MANDTSLAPVCIPADAFGPGLPNRDLRVSLQHRILVSGKIAQRMFNCSEVLVPAKVFIGEYGVRVEAPQASVTYVHIMLAQHEVLISEGIPTESLYLGQEALRALPAPALAELNTFFDLTQSPYQAARPFVKGRRAAQLLMRHRRNGRPLTQGYEVQRPTTA